MGKFNNDRKGGFGGDRGGRSFGGGGGSRGGSRFGGGFRGGDRGGDRGPVVMNDAVCDECQRPCQVPFRPTGDKPVYCKNCFDKRGGGREAGRFAGAAGNIAPGGFSINDIKTQLAMINIKLDRILKNNSLPIIPKKEEVVVEKTVKEEVVEIAPKKVLKSKKVSKK
jgi:CxxC-x17-CxxC domain-containing protein